MTHACRSKGLAGSTSQAGYIWEPAEEGIPPPPMHLMHFMKCIRCCIPGTRVKVVGRVCGLACLLHAPSAPLKIVDIIVCSSLFRSSIAAHALELLKDYMSKLRTGLRLPQTASCHLGFLGAASTSAAANRSNSVAADIPLRGATRPAKCKLFAHDRQQP